MNILSFKKSNYSIIKDKDDTERDIGYSCIENCVIIGRNSFYPNVLIYDNNNLYSPYDEKVMSLNKDSFYDNNIYELENKNIKEDKYKERKDEDVFFLIYNFDNYYHYLYDTLSYLYAYLELKKEKPELKLLINYPNKYKKEFYKFNEEILEKFVDRKDWLIHDDKYIYKRIFISSSLTHGGYSNNPPRKEIYELYNSLKNKLIMNKEMPKLVYISRRTWINNDKSNIGTDYTTRRKMMNEDLLVEELTKLGFTEIFAENLTTDDKINLFSKAEIVIGSIGGGMANLLFSDKLVKSIVLVTPYFLDINYRFKYSMEGSDIQYFNDVETYKEGNNIPLYCRAKIIKEDSEYYNKIGEINGFSNGKYSLNISQNDVAGFNNSITYNNENFYEKELYLLDKGLNSPYITNIEELIKIIEKIKYLNKLLE
jgi:capsular polysaccharide biosynthesis protein